jgi:hypothetical protein
MIIWLLVSGGYLSNVLRHIYIICMSEGEAKQKRPEFVNGVRVKAPEDYDFNTWGNPSLIQARTSQSIARISNCGQTQSGKRRS